jgi:hypothetical protein
MYQAQELEELHEPFQVCLDRTQQKSEIINSCTDLKGHQTLVKSN